MRRLLVAAGLAANLLIIAISLYVATATPPS